MRIILILFTFSIFLFADIHYAKLEPFSSVTIKAEVSGRVVFANEKLEGKLANGVIVKIDSKVDINDLKNSQKSLKLIEEMIKLNKDLLPQLQKNMQEKKRLYLNSLNLSVTSKSSKNSLYSAYIGAFNQFNATKEKILNLENQKINLMQKIVTLKDRLKKKKIILNNQYLYALNVREGDFVNIGMPIAIVKDTSKAKLTIYLTEKELQNINNKSIYINGKKSNLKFYKIWKVADSKYLSSYRAEIVLKPQDRFSKLIKVEIK